MARLVYGALFVALSFAAAYPLVRATHPPLQDLPQHLAAIHVLEAYPEQGLGELFELNLGRTQYIAYYGIAAFLAQLFGVTLANKLLLIAALVSLPWSIAALRSALGLDHRAALFAFPLLYNAHLVLGFFNFVAALPLMFFGLKAALDLRAKDTFKNTFVLAVWLLLTFYTHVVPFAFLALGSTLVLVGDSAWATLKRARAFVPVLIATGFWLSKTPAGQATIAATGAANGRKRPVFLSVSQALRELPMWLTDVLHTERDDQLLVAWFVLLLGGLAIGTRALSANDKPQRTLLPRIALLLPLAVLAYFVTPASYDWIWPISARFPLIAALFALLLLPRLRGFWGFVLLIAVSVVSFVGFREVNEAFVAFEEREVGDIDEAFAVIPEGERVAGLIFDRGSRHVKFSPFIHYVALYQAQKGGAVMFTFADFPQSPFSFREDKRPPRVPPRWEWTPERVDPAGDLTFYRYVLVRGGPGRIGRDPEHFTPVFRGSRWSVYKRI